MTELPSALGSSESTATITTIAILLDGDADFFSQALLSQGPLGGKRAAQLLRDQVCSRVELASSKAQVLCMCFWNARGLETYLQYSSRFSGALSDFASGFNSSSAGAFSIVDTGPSSQSADRALKRHLAMYLTLFDRIVLGGTHDARHVIPLFDIQPRETLRKITLLQTTPCLSPALERFDLPVITCDEGLFDGRDPNNGRRHLLDPSARSLSSKVSFKSLELDASTPSDDCADPFALLVRLVELKLADDVGGKSVPYNDLAGAIGGNDELYTAIKSARAESGEPEYPDVLSFLSEAQSRRLIEIRGRGSRRTISLGQTTIQTCR